MIKVFIKKWGEDIWEDYTDNLSGTIPDMSDKDISSLVTFTLIFQDLDDAIIDFETGWDLAVIDYDSDGTFIGIRDDKMLGKICRVETREVYGYSEYDEDGLAFPKFLWEVEIEQRDFSTIPFQLDYEGVKNVSDILPAIFQEHVRKELGGILPSGLVVDRYEFTGEDLEIINFKKYGLARSQLDELINSGILWELIGVAEEHGTNNLECFYKVRIWSE